MANERVTGYIFEIENFLHPASFGTETKIRVEDIDRAFAVERLLALTDAAIAAGVQFDVGSEVKEYTLEYVMDEDTDRLTVPEGGVNVTLVNHYTLCEFRKEKSNPSQTELALDGKVV